MITRRLLTRPAGALVSASWTCPSCTRAFTNASKSTTTITTRLPAQSRSSLLQRTQKRSLHHVPPLSYEETFNEYGVPGLFSPSGYKLAWKEYQTMLVQKLNELVAGEPYENMQAKDLAIMFARDPMNASLFNYASAAHNNQHFFSTLASKPQPMEECPQLQDSLIRTFGSIDTLRMTMLDTAASMFGPGHVWLVWAHNVSRHSMGRNGDWRILTTYNAGTPYAEAGYRQQGIDMANNNVNSYQDYRKNQHQQPVNSVGSFGPHTTSGKQAAKLPPGATSVMPVLSVSTWEHTYIYDFGLSGKRKFLEDWWKSVDWGYVEQNCPTEARQLDFAFMRA